ncbi:MAG: hypothetical protein KKH01_05450 [Firmicutes bacterium]|nr:hypothetical protein [Bacillota bacterium]
MKIPHLSRRLLFVMILFMTVISTSLYAYAYFENSNDYGFVIKTGEFEVTAYISFNDVAIDINSLYYDAVSDVIIINAYDEESENYIGNLKVDILIDPNIAARVRIKLLDEWELTRTYASSEENPIDPLVEIIYHSAKSSDYHPFSLLKVGIDYQPIYDSNAYGYLTEIIDSGQATLIHLIDGGDQYQTRENEVYYETCYVHLRIITEVVQANRFAEIWQLNTDFFDQ